MKKVVMMVCSSRLAPMELLCLVWICFYLKPLPEILSLCLKQGGAFV